VAKVGKIHQLAEVVVQPTAQLLSSEDYEHHVEELKRAANERSPSMTHLRQLLRESYHNRREWMKSLSTLDVQKILEKFPCLQQGKYVSCSFKVDICIYSSAVLYQQ